MLYVYGYFGEINYDDDDDDLRLVKAVSDSSHVDLFSECRLSFLVSDVWRRFASSKVHSFPSAL